MPDVFWNTTGQTPAQPVLENNTPGDALTNPLTIIRGADGVSADSPQLTADAEALFPTWDADGNIISSRPTTYSGTATSAEFLQWHSAHQLAWMAEFGTDGTAVDDTTSTAFKYATFGTNANDNENLHLVLSNDSKSIITLNYLQRQDIAMLPLDDQRAVVAHPAFTTTFSTLYNLTPQGTQTIADARADAVAIVDEAIAAIRASDSYQAGFEATFESDASVRTTYWHYMFSEQLQALSSELDNMAIFDIDNITLRVSDTAERFARVERVSDITAETTTNVLPGAVNALDGGTTIGSAFDTIVEIESRLYDYSVARQEIISSGTYEGVTLDAPGLTFVLQTLTNYQKEAEAEARTEDLNQRNALMEDYEAMQTLLNSTLSLFSAEDSSVQEELTIGGYATSSQLSADEQRVVAMFDSYYSALNSNTYHPYEVEKGLDRPTEAMVETNGALNAYTKEIWDALGLNLSEATGTLSRDNQQVMDEINGLNSEKNRHYDLASSTLSKMTGMLRSIIN